MTMLGMASGCRSTACNGVHAIVLDLSFKRGRSSMTGHPMLRVARCYPPTEWSCDSVFGDSRGTGGHTTIHDDVTILDDNPVLSDTI